MKIWQLMLSGIFLCGCSSTGKVETTLLNRPVTAERANYIEVFERGKRPPQAFREVALLTYTGVAAEYPATLRDFRQKAQELGADAIWMQPPQSIEPRTKHYQFRALAIEYLATQSAQLEPNQKQVASSPAQVPSTPETGLEPIQEPPAVGGMGESIGIAEGASGAGPQLIRSLSNMLHVDDPEALVGRSVELAKVTVQRVLDPQTLLVGADPREQILVRLSRPSPEIKSGQSIHLTGQIRRHIGQTSGWHFGSPNAPLAQDQPIFIEATSAHVLDDEW